MLLQSRKIFLDGSTKHVILETILLRLEQLKI